MRKGEFSEIRPSDENINKRNRGPPTTALLNGIRIRYGERRNRLE